MITLRTMRMKICLQALDPMGKTGFALTLMLKNLLIIRLLGGGLGVGLGGGVGAGLGYPAYGVPLNTGVGQQIRYQEIRNVPLTFIPQQFSGIE